MQEIPFDVCGGLSLGEYTALCFSGVLEFRDAVKLTAARGALMQAAAEGAPGCMYAVLGLGQQQTEAVCAEVAAAAGAGAAGDKKDDKGWCCVVANYLSDGNYSVSVSEEAADTLQTLARKAGAKKCVKLQVAGAFHSPLMRPAEEGLKETINSVSFCKPNIPVIFNCDAQIHTDPNVIKQKIITQASKP